MNPQVPSREKWRRDVADYAERYPLYERLKVKLEKDLSDVCSKASIHAIIQARPKSVLSFSEKLSRKTYENPCDDFTDLCAGRIITNTGNEVSTISKEIEKKYKGAIDWPNSLDHTKHLKIREFGYRSVHYIITLNTQKLDEDLKNMSNPRVEVQVRTLLEHAWSDIDHEYVYKPNFPIPDLWKRESFRCAALLENVDAAFNRMQVGLERYRVSYGTYLTPKQIMAELAMLKYMLEGSVYEALSREERANTAIKYGRLSAELDDRGSWEEAVGVITKYIAETVTNRLPPEKNWPLYLQRGILMCTIYSPNERKFVEGQGDLLETLKLSQFNLEALVSLADTYELLAEELLLVKQPTEQQISDRQGFEKQALQKYKEAYGLDPSDPRVLAHYLCWEIKFSKSSDIIRYIRPSILQAICRSQEQIEMKIYLPWAHYYKGLLNLLINDDDCRSAYSKAIKMTASRHVFEANIRFLKRIESIWSEIPQYTTIEKLLKVALQGEKA
ncbi:hypothetical protein BGW36DRAFT_432789 [Talaromyces proteolyticus]|uniref:RelA/SpoT domain-containing protein n=1 Tax=Talaromyces proteolyticus TaxID=1131652 RepID=A0AAD4PU67_9EURO|nr:uncharacterized protein BGW36DRAFT_432789 [Talaromyces proteolyticus]KAH8689817.1 hypothetical protein BGW36DRAFT_432789 [Talaromyces proteolyticus]